MTERYRVLLVEDDVIDQEAFRRHAARAQLPVEVTYTASLAGARDHLQRTPFDIALVDYHLPDGLGIDLLPAARHLPVIVVTGAREIAIAVEAMRAGAYDFISKDLEGAYLLALGVKIEHNITRWRAERELEDYRIHLEHVIFERTTALVEEQTRLKMVVEASPIVICSLNADGVIDFVAGDSERLLGLQHEQLQGHHSVALRQYMRPQDVEALLQARPFDRAKNFDIYINQRWLSMTVQPRYPDPPRTASEVSVVFYDITERKQAEEERRETERLQMEMQQERELLRLKEHFVAVVSHDLRTPLSIILSTNELLTRYNETLDAGERLARYERIRGQVVRMKTLLEDVLTFSKLNAQKATVTLKQTALEPFCLAIWQDVLDAHRSAETVAFDYASSVSNLVIDPAFLQYALVNLLSNAFKYSADDGSVTFRVYNAPGEIRFEIRDDGIGIPADDLPRLFEQFHRGQNATNIQGTGLGLAITQRYVALLGGWIDVQSVENEGSTFTVRLPYG